MNTNPKQWMWEQKYRPTNLANCILPTKDIEVFSGIIKSGRIPHLLLCSKSPGTGKTTMARVLCNELDAEVMFISGGEMRIDDLRGNITRFASSMTMKKGGKVLIIDESDNAGLKSVLQELRSWMEAYSHNCSVIMTCNNAEVIPDAIKSRCRVIEFGNPTADDKKRMMKEMIVRCEKICELENVTIESRKAVASLVIKNFPDLRGTITELDAYGKSGVIDEGVLTQSNRATEDFSTLLDALKTKQLGTVRQLVPKFTADYASFITLLYNKLFTEIKPTSIRMLIGSIAENQKHAATVSNLEIHILDLLVTVACEMEWK
ncbi:MAG: AAA family ATPase [Culicoidibacterales bacterium]